jgi:hypothetical protein
MQRFVTRRLVTASADGWTFGWPRKESTIEAKSFLKAPYSNSEISQDIPLVNCAKFMTIFCEI